ncbi:MAG TPA: 16S rRNA (guanine(966)-N(2))-methyltransferase RsmD [Candidatus Saccharimonadales bacterium]|nr:16S rRNA (guanine(966)-N(2))-methyltransferase RsmD [Candidatus Saccharimonadales bacterium]
MRIIAGRLGGRTFQSPPGHKTHPMSDKIRGALFNVLGDIAGLTVLDAFAGSGAISFEAISRGASRAVAIDSDRQAQRIIKENIAALGVAKNVQLIAAAVSAWLATSDQKFDLIICDPPYDDVKPALLTELATRCRPSGLVVLSLPPKQAIRLEEGYELVARKHYGDAELHFYRRLIAAGR